MIDLVFYGSLVLMGLTVVVAIVVAYQSLRELRRRRVIRALREFGVYMERLREVFGEMAVSAEYATGSLEGLRSTPSFQATMMDAEAERYATRTLPAPDRDHQEEDDGR